MLARSPDVMDVIIIGGGIIGASTAWRLAQAGAAVTLVDAGAPGGGGRLGGAGMLAPGGGIAGRRRRAAAGRLDRRRCWRRGLGPGRSPSLARAGGSPFRLRFRCAGTCWGMRWSPAHSAQFCAMGTRMLCSDPADSPLRGIGPNV